MTFLLFAPPRAAAAASGKASLPPREQRGGADLSNNGATRVTTNRRPVSLTLALAALGPVFLLSCTSNETKVRSAINAHTFWLAEYRADCVAVEGPADCETWQAQLNEYKRRIRAASRAVKVGPAKEQVKAMEQAGKAVPRG